MGAKKILKNLEGRRSAGADTENKYPVIAKERLQKAKLGTSKIRDRNKPIYKPDPKSKIAKRPNEWENNDKKKLQLH